MKVIDFFTWTQAFSIFAMYYSLFYAHRSIELWGYFQLASELATRYIWSNFAEYDFQFRTNMAADRKSNRLRWDRIDENLRARFLLTTKYPCSYCRNFNHRSDNCPYLKPDFDNRFGQIDLGNQMRPHANLGSNKMSNKKKIFLF